jgi:hypothetical protein
MEREEVGIDVEDLPVVLQGQIWRTEGKEEERTRQGKGKQIKRQRQRQGKRGTKGLNLKPPSARDDGVYPQTPFIFISGNDDTEN